MKNSIKAKTLKYDYCINCGLCSYTCPQKAISMLPNKYGEITPQIDNTKCNNCGLCSKICPNTQEKIKNEAIKISNYIMPQAFGLQDAQYYLAWNKDKEQRQKCCSGGVTTALAKYLLENKKINGMIHAERLWAKKGELHYGARLSTSAQEIEENVSSAYQPIDFSNVLEKLEEGKTYFITGTPCVIRGIKQLFKTDKRLKNINIITCALICSHNTNAQFIDFLTELNKLDIEEDWQVNIRQKNDTIPDANNFNNHIYTKDKTIMCKNRFESGWTDIWRSYYFAMNCCNYCSDFWGYEADISVKDAWGKWSDDPLGKSIVILRNMELKQDLTNSNIGMEELSYEDLENHQYGTSIFKQTESYNKNFKSPFSRSNIKNGLLKNIIISKSSKFLYKNFGFYITKKLLKIFNKNFLRNKTKHTNKLPILQIICFLKSLKSLVKYKNKDMLEQSKNILVAGGYGYGNTGDEAQCNETLKTLTKRYPDYQIVNLTPNVSYSKTMHPQYFHSVASRVVFYDSGKPFNCFDYNKNSVKLYQQIVFFTKFILIYINAFLVRANLPTFLINAGIASFLYQLKNSSMLYFCGGGYLTGSTLSRLWDGILLCRMAHLFKVPVVMSGQTIGVWETEFNKKLAKWGFKYVEAVTVRDETFSLNDLKEIDLSGDNYFATHDDALFCEKSTTQQVDIQNYITLNFHYWGMNDEDKNIYIEKIHKIVDFVIKNTDYNIVFIPMIDSDKLSFNDYIKKYPENRFICFNYDYDFKKIRKVIADSKMCITMKHHPIIFAMGENVPVISLAFSDYYVHKNLGALMQYGMDKYSINLENNNYFEMFENLFNEINTQYDTVINTIINRKEILKQRKEKFLKLVDDILQN